MARGTNKVFGIQKDAPHFSYPHTVADVAAIQALNAGTATKEQQQRALRWIIETASMTYDNTFDPQSERTTSFMQGRRFVGQKLILMTKLDTAKLKRMNDPTLGPSEHGE